MGKGRTRQPFVEARAMFDEGSSYSSVTWREVSFRQHENMGQRRMERRAKAKGHQQKTRAAGFGRVADIFRKGHVHTLGQSYLLCLGE